MSHTTAIKAVKLQSVTALQAAVDELRTKGVGIAMVPDATPRAYFSGQAGMGKADFVLKLDQSKYDIGLYKQEDGSFEARTDFYGGDIERILGGKAVKPENTEQARMGRLFQTYAIHAAMEAARKKGLMTRRLEKEDGTVQLEITGATL